MPNERRHLSSADPTGAEHSGAALAHKPPAVPMNARGPRSKKNPVTVSGPWFAMPLEFVRSRACADLSPQACKMLVDLCAGLGPNARGNGDLSAAPGTMRPRGWTSTSGRVAALLELEFVGLIVITRRGCRGRCTSTRSRCGLCSATRRSWITGRVASQQPTGKTSPLIESHRRRSNVRRNGMCFAKTKSVYPPRDNPPPTCTRNGKTSSVPDVKRHQELTPWRHPEVTPGC